MYYVSSLVKRMRDHTLDYIIVTGDLTSYGSITEAYNILSILKSISQRLYFIPGDYDHKMLAEYSWDDEGLINVHGKCYQLNEKYFIVGVGGGLLTAESRNFQLRDQEIYDILNKAISKCKDSNNLILITHTPPLGLQCDVEGYGSLAIREIAREFKPLLIVSGHIHDCKCISLIDEVKVVLPGPLRRGYYSIISIVDHEVNVYLERIDVY